MSLPSRGESDVASVKAAVRNSVFRRVVSAVKVPKKLCDFGTRIALGPVSSTLAKLVPRR